MTTYDPAQHSNPLQCRLCKLADIRDAAKGLVDYNNQIGPIHQALAGYMERAAEKLRAEGMCCLHVTLLIRASPFSELPAVKA